MNITLVNTYQSSGGAAVACLRLAYALQHHSTNVTMLVQEKSSEVPFVVPILHSRWGHWQATFRFALDRLYFSWFEKSRQERFSFSHLRVGMDIHQHPAIRQADIIHLHWVYFGFLSLDSLRKLFALGKPIVWTLHDMWVFTGGCHYSRSCTRYTTHCQQCPFLKHPSDTDLAFRVFKQKKALFQNVDLHIVTCSQWLAEVARSSALLSSCSVTAIPNPINTCVYQPTDAAAIRADLGLPAHKKLILFGAMNTQETRKGFVYLLDALTQLAMGSSELAESVALVIFGKADDTLAQRLPFPLYSMGYVHGDAQLAKLYNACDVMVFPSLEDNLPNTVMESLACGTPVVAFRTGGLPEMIRHKENGYLATYQSAEDLANGILYVLDDEHYTDLCLKAREFVMQSFTEEQVAGRYQALYEQIMRK